jgi:drug/metabolite transporter (DMT)-like permease
MKVAVHFLPLGLIGFVVVPMTTFFQRQFALKWIINAGLFLAIVGNILLPFVDSPHRYWRFAFPAFLIGSSGICVAFTTLNIAVYAVTKPEQAGVVGSILQCALQLGAAAGIAICTSIQTSIDSKKGGPQVYAGRAAAFWFLLAYTTSVFIAMLFVMKNTVPPVKEAGGAAAGKALQDVEMNGFGNNGGQRNTEQDLNEIVERSCGDGENAESAIDVEAQ